MGLLRAFARADPTSSPWLFGDRGRPASLRRMDGFGSHTFQWVNEAGEGVWVKYHFKTDQGIGCLFDDDLLERTKGNPECLLSDLRDSIDSGSSRPGR